MADTTRIEQLLEKLEHPKNTYAKSQMAKWFKDSADWAERIMELHGYHKTGSTLEGLRVLYICNHLCPNLVHLKHKPVMPDANYVRQEPEAMEEYWRMYYEYEYENTQVALANNEGEIVQPGIHQTADEFALIQQYVERMQNNG